MYDPDLPPEEASVAASLERPSFYIHLAKPIVSRVMLGVLLVAFLIEVVYGAWAYGTWMTFSGTNVCALVDLGAKVNPLVAAGQYWRLYTATLLHSGIIHLLFNLYALFALGPMLESYIGSVRFAAIYLVGGLVGSLASYAFSTDPAGGLSILDGLSVGASGAVFAVIGGITVYFARYHSNFGAQGRAILQNMVIVIVINLIYGSVAGNIDNWGHIGGLVGGVVVALGVLPRYQPPSEVRLGQQPLEVVERRTLEIAWTAGVVALLVAGVYFVTINYPNPSLQALVECAALRQ
jgi:rhomboid protease GluP